VATVVELVGTRPLVLYLDNLEHLLACAPDLAAVVERCPALLLVVTSRAPLRIRAEHELVVTPLEVPDAWATANLEEVGEAPAVAMLLERAAAMGSPIALTPETAETVSSIVWRLDGLPLAIELAAARSRALGPDLLLARLDQALSEESLRDLPERQQTVAATVDWSVELLSEPQRRLFAALAVFEGGFDLEAAEAVGPGPDVLAGLTALVEQSLVSRVGGARYRLLEPVRQYASARWSATPEGAESAERHAAYFAGVAAEARSRLRGAELAPTLDALDRDHANLRTAHDYLLAAGRHAEAARLAWDVWLFLAVRGRAEEWRDRLTGELGGELGELHDVARARWLGARGALGYAARDLAAARPDIATAVDLSRAAGDEDLVAETAALAALMSVFVGDVDGADGFAAVVSSAHTESVTLPAVLLAATAGQGAILRDDLDRADESLAAAEQRARRLGNGFALALVLNMRATVAERRDDDGQALSLLAESVERSVRDRMGWTLGYALPALAAVAARTGDDLAAALLSGAAATLTGSPEEPGHVPASRAAAHRSMQELRPRLGADAYRQSFDRGRTLALDDVGEVAADLRRRELE
jgi:predicted ATPase